MADARIRLVPDGERDEEVPEEWERDTDDFLGGAIATRLPRGRYPWQVSVGIMEFVREEPLEGDRSRAIGTRLSAVVGVTAVAEEDREVWVVEGNPSGADLVEAVGRALDSLADRSKQHYDGLLGGD